MTESTKPPLTIGQKVERIRMFKGLKQEYVASRLGISQPQFSKIEQSDKIEEQLLKQIAEILEVTPQAIENFEDEKVTYIINHQYNFHHTEIKDNASSNFIFNPIEKITELYERLLVSEKEKASLETKLKHKENE